MDRPSSRYNPGRKKDDAQFAVSPINDGGTKSVDLDMETLSYETADQANRKKIASISWLLLPLAGFILLAIFIIIDRMGIPYHIKPIILQYLPLQQNKKPKDNSVHKKAIDTLVLYDSKGIEGPVPYKTLAETLNKMQVHYDAYDVQEFEDLPIQNYLKVIVVFTDLNKVQNSFQKIDDAVVNGTSVLIAIRPDPSPAFQAFYRKLGIISKGDVLFTAKGIKFLGDTVPFLQGSQLGQDFLTHHSIPVQLEKDAQVFATSADELSLPLMWEYRKGNGKFIVINSDQFVNRVSAGFLAAAYSLLQDVTIYPVINSSVIFINNFPGPLPEGFNATLSQQFGRNIESFYMNIWWPDMQTLAEKQHLKYTGLYIGTYSENTLPPFNQSGDSEQINYLGSTLLKMGGEIGLQGFNRVPLCRVGEAYASAGGVVWTESKHIQDSVIKTLDFLKDQFPQQNFSVYAPVDGVLCAESEEWLAKKYPLIRAISSDYESTGKITPLLQNFDELDNGIISFPIIHHGYYLNDYQKWLAANQLLLQYVSSFSINPNAVLDQGGEGKKGWTELRKAVEEQTLWLSTSAPGLRNMIASEGAMAVQRYDRLSLNYEVDDDRAGIHLGNFYDIAWLLLRSKQEPVNISGGNMIRISSDLYLIEAKNAELTVQLKGKK